MGTFHQVRCAEQQLYSSWSDSSRWSPANANVIRPFDHLLPKDNNPLRQTMVPAL